MRDVGYRGSDLHLVCKISCQGHLLFFSYIQLWFKHVNMGILQQPGMSVPNSWLVRVV